MVQKKSKDDLTPESPGAFINRELSWLRFARRVFELAKDPTVPLLERVKFAGILGMLHDEFFMKRVSGLKRQINKGVNKLSLDGMTPTEELAACRKEVLKQNSELSRLLSVELRPALADHGIGIVDLADLTDHHRADLTEYFKRSVLPILTPLAVDAEHPFPFIRSLGLNLAVIVKESKRGERFVRVHRNCLVARSAVRGFEREEAEDEARWVVLLDGVEERIGVSRRQQHIVREFSR